MVFSDAELLALPIRRKPYKHFLGEGLFVHVFPNGKKYWRLKYHLGGRQGIYSIGVFPKICVAEALEAKTLARDLIGRGENPTAVKRQTAKLKLKPHSAIGFRLVLSTQNGLTIETDTKLVTLTPGQTKALRAFLVAHEGEEEVEV